MDFSVHSRREKEVRSNMYNYTAKVREGNEEERERRVGNPEEHLSIKIIVGNHDFSRSLKAVDLTCQYLSTGFRTNMNTLVCHFYSHPSNLISCMA